jgi:hypothetical protein
MKLLPLPFFIGLAAGLALLSTLGATVQSTSLIKNFVRFHQFITPEAAYHPTARQIRAIVDRTEGDDSLIYVIIGGSSVLQGVGQHISLLWSLDLQERLGVRFRVINFAQRAGRSSDFGNVAAEYLLRRSKRVIFVGSAGAHTYANRLSDSRHSRTLLDAWRRNYLLPWAPRDEMLSAIPLDGPEALREQALGAVLDTYLSFNDLWNFVSFDYANLNWSSLLNERSFRSRSTLADPELLPEQYEPRRYRDDNARALGIERRQILPPNSAYWQSFDELTKQMVPPRLRGNTLVAITLDSPHYLHQLTASEQARYLQTARTLGASLARLGFRRVAFATADLLEEDYIDRVHLSVSGGRKISAAMAPAIREMAVHLGYMQ